MKKKKLKINETKSKRSSLEKSRKFGDVKGGRMRPKLADNIFNRQHNLETPSENDETPIFIKDNPSRDFFPSFNRRNKSVHK